jgi:phi13 family phage major tail protein
MPDTVRNKYRYDVKNVHYIVGEQAATGAISFTGSTWKPLYGVKTMTADPQGESANHRADGINYITTSDNTGYNITLNQILADEDFQRDVLSFVKDTNTGITYEDANAEPKPFALAGEFTGSHEGIRWIFYNCIAGRTKITGDNKDKQKDPDTDEFPITASPTPFTIDGSEVMLVKGSVKKSDKEATYNQWFDHVIFPGDTVTTSQTPAQNP